MNRLYVVAILLAVAGSPVMAQEPDSLATPSTGPNNCVLVWEPLSPTTTSLSIRDTPETHVSYISGRMLWTCGTATMEADSAVNHESMGQVDLIGNVVYRDTIRTLESRLLTYFQVQDLVIARDSVVLVRTTDNSRLEGPHVEFLRAVSGVDELTTATGRPHMTLYPAGSDPGTPYEIDADRTVFAGEEEARAYGNVVLIRDDLSGAADSAYMRRSDEVGILWGDPWIDARGVRLEGDTIRFRSAGEELEEIHAIGDGHAIGESFEVRAERIDVTMEGEEPDRVWAYGEGRSAAISGSHNLYGDSIEFAMYAGSIDTVYSVGEALAIQEGAPRDVGLPRGGPDAPTVGPLTEDSFSVTEDSLVAPGDSLVAPADSVFAVPDSMTTVAAPRPGPRLRVDGDQNWIQGDTLLAIFERPAGAEPADSLATAPESAPDPIMERLIAIGNARSFYTRVRDSTKTNRRSRNYMLGARIDILFEDGEPAEVLGVDAVGVFLDPDEGAGGAPLPVPDPRVVPRVPVDSVGNPIVPDSLVSPPDSVATLTADSMASPPDTTRVPAGGLPVLALPSELRGGGPIPSGAPRPREWPRTARTRMGWWWSP